MGGYMGLSEIQLLGVAVAAVVVAATVAFLSKSKESKDHSVSVIKFLLLKIYYGRSLQGIRIIQAAAGAGRTMLISDAGQVYAIGKDSFGEAEYGAQGINVVNTPQLVDSLKNIFVVKAAIGNFFIVVLSREGRVYTFSWGNEKKIGHQAELNDLDPHPLLGALENRPVVQIAVG
ncbi:hypothetical protein AgCh_025890 [Apium graveolens]